MSEYEDVLILIEHEFDTYVGTAKTFIPRLRDVLLKDGKTPEEIKDRILADCEKFWTRETIMNALGDDFKNVKQRETGKQKGKIKAEIMAISNNGQTIPDDTSNFRGESINTSSLHSSETFVNAKRKLAKIGMQVDEQGQEVEVELDNEDLQIKLNDLQTALENEKNERLQFQKLLDREREKVKELESITTTTTSTSHFTPASELKSKKEDEDGDDASPVIRAAYKKIIGELNSRILELKDKLVTNTYRETIEIRGQAIVVNIRCSNLESIEIDELASRRLNQ